MTLEALPGRSGGLMPQHLNPRPCTYKPPQWWDQGHPYNPEAKRLCREVCPQAAFRECEMGPPVFGMIKAGALYDDKGHLVPEPHRCDDERCRKCRGVVADHHLTIATLRAQGVPFRMIAEVIGFSQDATRVYWHARGKYKEQQATQGA